MASIRHSRDHDKFWVRLNWETDLAAAKDLGLPTIPYSYRPYNRYGKKVLPRHVVDLVFHKAEEAYRVRGEINQRTIELYRAQQHARQWTLGSVKSNKHSGA